MNYKLITTNMKLRQLSVVATIVAIIIGCQMGSKSDDDKSTNEQGLATYAADEANPPCTAHASWFKMVNGKRVTPAPAEGAESPFANNESVTNCDFHQWSWQKFLWLTNETNGKPFFLTGLIQVGSDGHPVDTNQGVFLTDVAQASDSSDVIVVNKNYNNTKGKDTVYYSIHMSNIMHETMIKYAPIAKENPDSVKYRTFPVGALEVKISWVNVNTIPASDTSSFFVTDGFIRGDSNRIALTGMHVVGVVENHPEFVWATFEHFDLAPMYDWSKATPTTDAPVTSTSNKLFFDSTATASVNNINGDSTTNHQNIFSVYKYGVPVEIVDSSGHNVKRFVKTSQKEPENYNHISQINDSVKSQLSGVWSNYFYNGSIWVHTEGYNTTTDQAELLNYYSFDLGNVESDSLLRGSVAASNLTMETYVQVGFKPSSIHGTQVGELVNCFTCHNANGDEGVSPLFISHVFNGYVNSLKGMTKAQIKQSHLDEIKQEILLRAQSK
jgi:hypothetical protein